MPVGDKLAAIVNNVPALVAALGAPEFVVAALAVQIVEAQWPEVLEAIRAIEDFQYGEPPHAP